MAYLPAQRLRLYRNFKAIDAADYHGIIRYFEHHEDGIRTLDEQEYFECALAYTEALFEVGQYGKHSVMCDHLLEFVIVQNIERWSGEDIFARLLFKKAVSLFQQREYTHSEHILRERIKLYPDDQPALRLLYACLTRQRPAWLAKTRAVAIGLAFLAVAAVGVELFVVRPFFWDYYETSLLLHNVLLIGALATLAGGEFRHAWLCRKAVRTFARQAYERRSTLPH